MSTCKLQLISNTHMNKKLDPELMAYFFDIKEKITQEHQEYVSRHPEIKQILVDFLTKLLMTKPENIYTFTTEYFSFFEKHSLKPSLNPLVIVGCRHSGKKALARKLVELYPQYFEHCIYYTTKPLSAEERPNPLVKYITTEEFIEQRARDDFAAFETDGEFYTKIVSKSYLKDVSNKGKICLVPLTLKSARLYLNTSATSNFMLIVPSSMELMKERIINKREVPLEAVEDAMNQIKAEIEESSDINMYFAKLINDRSEKSEDEFTQQVKKVYSEFQF